VDRWWKRQGLDRLTAVIAETGTVTALLGLRKEGSTKSTSTNLKPYSYAWDHYIDYINAISATQTASECEGTILRLQGNRRSKIGI